MTNDHIAELQKIFSQDIELRNTIDYKNEIQQVIKFLDKGIIRVAEKVNDQWVVNQWIKRAILLYFKVSDNQQYEAGCFTWRDKIQLKSVEPEDFRTVPGSIIRSGSYVGNNSVIMPSFINIGAYVDAGCLIDTWATIGSCAQIGKNCHISGGSGIGGVLEPIGNKPVIIEDNCFIGARSEIVEGVIIEEGAVIGMGVFIGASTKIVYRDTGEIIYGRVPQYSVVVPGVLPSSSSHLPGLYCAVILKQVDASTRQKTSINQLLRS